MTQTPSRPVDEAQLQGFAEFIQRAVQEWNIPGCAVAVVKDGTMVFAHGSGKRDLARQLAVTPRTLFPIASCTKAFTATALGMLVDEGRLDWDTPIKHYLPAFKLYDAFASERVTLRDLLAHRSGLPRHDLLGYHSSLTRSQLVARLQYLEPNKDLRSTWQYNNLMYALAGHLIEVVSGISWEEFLKQRLLAPLAMTNSTTSVHLMQQASDFALPYQEEYGELRQIPFHEIGLMAPAGALSSNVEEMCHWLLLQLQKGRFQQTQLISQEQLAQLHKPHMTGFDAHYDFIGLDFFSYALGWQLGSYRGHRLIQHAGGIDGFSSLMTFLPDDQVGIVVLINKSFCIAPIPITFNACDRLLGLEAIAWNERIKLLYKQASEAERAKMNSRQHLTRIPNTQPSHPLSAYVGDYEHPGYGPAAISHQDKQLLFTYNNKTYPLTHVHYDIFEATLDAGFPLTTTLSFTTDVTGEIASLAARLEPEVQAILFTRVPPISH